MDILLDPCSDHTLSLLQAGGWINSYFRKYLHLLVSATKYLIYSPYLSCNPLSKFTMSTNYFPFQDSLRMLVSQDLDVSMSMYIQFYFRYGCKAEQQGAWPREQSVLVQYSNNGGISWHLVREIHHKNAHIRK